jgi:uncharacterized membrane protein YeaQ/YmgE (transglycosylase-associated protein family)
MGIIWTILIGFVAGVLAKFIMPGANERPALSLRQCSVLSEPSWLPFSARRSAGGAGLIGATVGAVIVLFVYSFVAGRRRAV